MAQNWRIPGGHRAIGLQGKSKIEPARFISTVQALVASPDEELPNQIKSIRQNLKMDPTALFAAQYAEAIKLRKGVDPIIKNYEQLESAYQAGMPKPLMSQSKRSVRNKQTGRGRYFHDCI